MKNIHIALACACALTMVGCKHTSFQIRMNQVGFRPQQEKTATIDVCCPEAEPCSVVILSAEGDTVWTGMASATMLNPVSGKPRQIVDFSTLTEVGDYTLQVNNEMSIVNCQLSINNHPYRELTRKALRAFYYQRASMDIVEPYAEGYERKAGHPDDKVLVHASAATAERPEGTVISSPGGWYDAGDYNKYIVNSGFTMGVWLMAYEMNKEYFDTINLNIPESKDVNCQLSIVNCPDMLAEAMYNIRWMLTMQDTDGGVYHKLTEANFEGFIRPDECQKTRYVVLKTTAAALDFAATMALAARVYAPYESVYPGFVEEAAKAALRAYAWAEANPEIYYDQPKMNEQFKPEITTGAYDDFDVRDEFYWAATELYLLTHDEAYKQTAVSYQPSEYIPAVWGNVAELAVIEWLMHWQVNSKSDFISLQSKLLAHLEPYIAEAATVSVHRSPYGNRESDFFWGCNSEGCCWRGVECLYAYRLTGDEKYRVAAEQCLNYILGQNATGYCYVTGFGQKPTNHPHHRLSYSHPKGTHPGFLAGGPNPMRQDAETDGVKYPKDVPADESYLDYQPSYASNEVTINWNVTLFALSAGIDALDRPEIPALLRERGCRQAKALWTKKDGTDAEFRAFVQENQCVTQAERLALFESLSRILENCYQSADMLTVDLLKPTQLTNAGDPQTPDWIMSAYSPLAHFSDDMFANKLAFVAILNFPHYSLEEKNTLGRNWTRLEWAMARMGDVFTTRVPAAVNARLAQANADAENYIADYNIYMGNLRTDDGRQLWPDDKILLSHWNLRDELKALYADKQAGQEKQEMICQLMQRIVNQTIPVKAINSPDYVWQPYSTQETAEPYTRYERILAVARALFDEDKYCPSAPTGIQRNFEEGVEIPAAELDSLFRALVGSEQVTKVAAVIRERLGRELRPYDIWYDGFKVRASLNEDALTAQTRKLYPDANAFAADMPRLLTSMGFYSEDARTIAHHIVVEPARGSGHAWPSLGRKEDSRLRTRIPAAGMDYKGYNIAVHEFGHCVEQVLDMYYIDYYMLSGVPNTAYTEASAFLWQHRDLQLLPQSANQRSSTPQMSRDEVLDQFWSMYEIMGVSLVDMGMWRWIYEHPQATAKQLCEAVQQIAKEVWNTYYEPVLGGHDCMLLAIYSHMVNAPMYLPNYPLGHIVQYQLEEHLAQYGSQRDFAGEYARIYRLGRLTPKEWMMQAVGAPPSVEPILRAVEQCTNEANRHAK